MRAFESEDRIGAEQARILYSNIPAAVTAAGSAALLLLWVLVRYQQVPADSGERWAALALACISIHPTLWLLRRRAPDPSRHWRAWLGGFRLACLVEGLACTAVALFMPRAGRMEDELFVVLVASASVSGALPFFAADLWSYGAYFFPTIGPYVVIGMVDRFPNHDALAVMTAAFLAFMWWIARRTNAQLVDGLKLRFENVDLLEEVRLQKTRAEDASAAKSQFLAAASHDLRQPLHALSLFIGAMRLRRMDSEARRLLDHLGLSVTAMDGLFGALLDMTRLDAGVMRAELSSFPLRPLIERISREYRAEAQAKGLRLRVRCGDVRVRSDPVLVERILRNLIGNAVRYTDRGGVLIGCRPSGDAVRVEVWDSGRGIAPDHQMRIFREFYQVTQGGADGAVGLGLGLAIVQRMAALLDCPLTLTSHPGRGSVFRIELPRAPDAADQPAPAPDPARRGLILVLDDETSVREGMSALLAGWGHEVLAAGTGPEMLRRLDGRLARPDLIICDYGLDGGENGVAAIRSLRSRIGSEVPAMLVSGDARPRCRGGAQAAGLLLLHKPVTNSRLRAAVGNLMRPTAG